jgi:prepilin-type N-terminal cleavage/methylation domain-containing protein
MTVSILNFRLHRLALPKNDHNVTHFERPKMQRSPAITRHSTRGFTLVEMLLVLALMIVLLGIAYPSLAKFRLEQQLKQGAELVRLQMKQARLRAMESGLEYQFRYEPGGRQFIVVPADYSAIQAQQMANQQSGNGKPQSMYWKTHGKFEAKVNFSKTSFDPGVAPQPLPKEFLSGFDRPDDLSRIAWAAPLIFHTDGSARDFAVEIEDEKGAYLTLSVRGITGSIELSQMLRRTRR